MKKILLSATALAVIFGAVQTASAHISYSGRNFGTLVVGAPATSINTQTVSSSFGWADATDTDWGDTHRTRFFRFTLSTTSSVMITIERNGSGNQTVGNGTAGGFLPAVSVFSGLSHTSSPLAHDSSSLSVEWLVQTFGSSADGKGGSGKEGSLNALGNWSIGNSVTDYPTPSASGDSLRSFTYIGHAADGTSANFGSTPGIQGDGNADGILTATFNDLTPGDYSISIGGANYAAQLLETGPTFPTYGVNVSVQAVPEPSTWAMIALASGLGLWIMGRRKSA